MEANRQPTQRIGRQRVAGRFFSTALALVILAACSKAPENAAGTTPAPAVANSGVAQPAAAEPATSVAPPSDSPAVAPAAATAVPEPAAPAAASAHAGVAAKPKAAAKPAAAGAAAHSHVPEASGPAGASAEGPKKFDCGEKGQPVCPLQGFMKSQMATAAASGDGALLAKAFDDVAAHAPPGLASWSAIAKGGAAKARSGDIDGAKASCKACHDQYKTRYKAEMRDRAW